jgi:MarR family transcriptional regulator, transcriptional regulator for hemolysin
LLRFRAVATPAAAKPTSDLLLLLSQASHALTAELTARLAEIGISPRSHSVLSTAMRTDLTQNRLAELCALDKTTMVVTIDELERAGLAERHQVSTDRRARIISVTEPGRRIVARAGEIVTGLYDEVLAVLPSPQRQAFLDGLERLVSDRLATPVQRERPARRRPARTRRQPARIP